MRRKVVKISLLVISLMLSITIPILTVTAKKQEWVLDPTVIDDSIESGFMWSDYASEPWLKGSGTEEDPYMIKNVVINGEGSTFCLVILNSVAYFKIMDCTFYNTKPPPGAPNAALILVSTQNGVIFKNQFFDCGWPGSGSGITLIASSNNKIQKNLVYDNGGPGIYLQYSNDNVIRQNLCYGNTWGILIAEWSNYNEVTKNDCYDNEDHGILLWTESNGNSITKNDCKRNLNGGITVSGSHGNVITDNECSNNIQGIILTDGATFNEVINNTCYENLGSGITVISGWESVITDNECNDNSVAGIFLMYSNNNFITENLCKRNQWGIYIGDWSSYNEISNNDCSNNIETGIHLYYFADYNVITNNDCKENYGSGITLSTSNGNIISKNNCSNNVQNGIFIVDWWWLSATDNILYGNNIENNFYGVMISNVDNNDVFRNTIKGNYFGIRIEWGSDNNLIYHNNIIDNGVQAWDAQSWSNFWYNPYMLEGNYWSDYTGMDSDGDEIGDTPWPWPGFDEYPFMEEDGWEYLTPIEEEILTSTNRLGAYRTVHSNEISYLIVGLGQLFSERINNEFMPPYTIRLWFYGFEVFFQGNFWYFDTEGIIYPELGTWQLFYIIFPPDFLTLQMGLPTNLWHYVDWQISFYSYGEQQYMDLTSYFYLV